MYVGHTWRDGHSKRVAVYGFFEEMPVGLQRFFFAFGGAIVCLGLELVLGWVGVLDEPHPLFLLGSAVLAGALGGRFGPPWITRKWRQLGELGLVDSDSYAFEALKWELAQRGIFISDMNDRIDHEVGVKPISTYLRLTKEGSYLIDAGNLEAAQEKEVKETIDRFAFEHATMIRYYFDQRELARQARELGENAEALRIEAELQLRITADHAARAEIWLLNYRAGVLD